MNLAVQAQVSDLRAQACNSSCSPSNLSAVSAAGCLLLPSVVARPLSDSVVCLLQALIDALLSAVCALAAHAAAANFRSNLMRSGNLPDATLRGLEVPCLLITSAKDRMLPSIVEGEAAVCFAAVVCYMFKQYDAAWRAARSAQGFC
jgi:hypothetical protein